jgi:hypothetical protein
MWAVVRGRAFTVRGYAVNAKHSVDLLAKSNARAAEWWRTYAPHLLDGRRNFVFDEGACRVEVEKRA